MYRNILGFPCWWVYTRLLDVAHWSLCLLLSAVAVVAAVVVVVVVVAVAVAVAVAAVVAAFAPKNKGSLVAIIGTIVGPCLVLAVH